MTTSGFRQFAAACQTHEFHVGKDTSSFEYTDIGAAVAAAGANDTIKIHPGTYTLSEKITVNKPLRFLGDSGVVVTSTSTLGDSMFLLDSFQITETGYFYFENIIFQHGADDENIFDVDNSEIDEPISVVFQNCPLLLYDTSSTGKAINVIHSDSSRGIQIVVGSCKRDQIGCINFAVEDEDDLIQLHGVKCVADGNATAIITSATDAAAGVELCHCYLPHEAAVSGGHASQTLKSYYSYTASDYADANDFTGSHTATILGVPDTDT
jgi:hypothetical protein